MKCVFSAKRHAVSVQLASSGGAVGKVVSATKTGDFE